MQLENDTRLYTDDVVHVSYREHGLYDMSLALVKGSQPMYHRRHGRVHTLSGYTLDLS